MDSEKAKRERALLEKMGALYRHLATALAAGQWQEVEGVQPLLAALQEELALLSRVLGPARIGKTSDPGERRAWEESQGVAREALRLCQEAQAQARGALLRIERRLGELGRSRQGLAKYRPSRWYHPRTRFTSYCA